MLGSSACPRNRQLTGRRKLFGGVVAGEIGNYVFGGFSAVGAADASHGTQAAEIVEELVAFLVLTLQLPKGVFWFGHAHDHTTC